METYLHRLLRAGRPVLIGWALLLAAAVAVYLDCFRIDNSVGAWFLTDDPELAVHRDYQSAFGAREWTFAVIETESIYDPEFLAALRAAGERIAALDHVERVVSIANARDSETDAEDTLRYRPILDLAAGPAPAGRLLPAAALEAFRRRLHDNPIFPGNLFQPGDERHAAVLIRNDDLIGTPDPYRIELVDAVREVLAAIPQVRRFALAGTTVINAELNRAARRDMFRYYLLIGLFLVICGGLFLPHRRDLAVLLAVVTGAVLPSLGLVAALGWRFNMLTIMLPTVLVAIGVSAVVHLINDFHHERRRQGFAGGETATRAALARTLQALWRPALWTTLTTVVGFLSLSASSVVPVRQLGLLAAFGIGLAWLHGFVLGPLLLHALWSKRPSTAVGGGGIAAAIARSALHLARARPAWTLLLGAALIAALAGLARLEANTDYVRFFRPDSTLRADYERIAATHFAQYYLSLEILYPGHAVYTDQPGFGQIEALAYALEALPEVHKVLGAGRLLREADRALVGARAPAQAFAGFGADKLAQVLLLAEASANRDLTELVTGDGGRTQLQVLTDYLSTRQLQAFRARIEALGTRYLPAGMKPRVTGTNLLWANMDAQVVRTQALSLAITAGVVALLLPLVLRSPLLGLLGLTVSLIPVAVTLGVMGWVGIRVNIATCLIGAVALGVAVDDSIYLLSRLQWERRRGVSPAVALARAVRVSGAAMATTSLILMGGFLTMAGSDFLPSAHFGLLFAMTVVLALIGDLVLLPALLLRLYRREAKTGLARTRRAAVADVPGPIP